MIGKGCHPLTAALYLKRVEGKARDGKPIRPRAVTARTHALTRMPAYIRQSGLREMLQQGIIERAVFIMTLSADQAIEPGYIVTDYDGTVYDVLHVINWHTHKEGFLRKMN